MMPNDAVLKAHGIKPSLTRMMIFEYLKTAQKHPNVDEIYQALQSRIPTLSKTTVYNTLHLFTEKSIARAVMLKDQENRYDLAAHPHAHFQCLHCNEVFDVAMMPDFDLNQLMPNHEIQDVSVLISGVCETCKAKEAAQKSS